MCDLRQTFTGYRGGVCEHSFEDYADKAKIGIWVADSIEWAKGYAERKAAKFGGRPFVQEVTYTLANALELGDIEEAATDASLQELADGSGIPFEKLCELRLAAGWNGDELDEPCLFEITNTQEFITLAKSLGYDGMIGSENAGQYRVACIFNKQSIASVKAVADTNVMGE